MNMKAKFESYEQNTVCTAYSSDAFLDTIHLIAETIGLTSSVVHLIPVDFLIYGGLAWPIPLDTTVSLVLAADLDDVFLLSFW